MINFVLPFTYQFKHRFSSFSVFLQLKNSASFYLEPALYLTLYCQNMKQIKILFISLLFVALLGSAYAWFFVWNKPQQNIQQASAISINATDLFNAYSLNEVEANQTYIDKVLAVTGEVSNVGTNSEGKTVVMLKSDDLMFGVNCTLEEDAQVKNGETITLKGLCTGYLTDVVLIRCYKIDNAKVQL